MYLMQKNMVRMRIRLKFTPSLLISIAEMGIIINMTILDNTASEDSNVDLISLGVFSTN
ncbi:hypothetical protein SSYM_1362 [Serratia symbiotica str. Tucson]|uniref:Uncharacterized protein n=1 Tax=Serratia symbiotica str. Tucson TaxID=914128 RepID=E9CM48_9GAMM|nr:hypothetical protein SSYM_1362 [Serratia symbiotica str. Tucson]